LTRFLCTALALCGSAHTKCKKMAGHNIFKISLLNDGNMVGEHKNESTKYVSFWEKALFDGWPGLT
jgi:hypothetical protein